MRRGSAFAVLVIALAVFLPLVAHAAGPFGVGVPEGSGAAPAFLNGILAYGAKFYQTMIAAMQEAARSDTAPFLLLGVSFVYGFLHTVGPGHGKAVISAYLFASGEAARRGVALAFGFALIQALSAIVIVALLAMVFSASARTMDLAALTLERIASLTIVAVGVYLVWIKGRAVLRLVRAGVAAPVQPALAGLNGFSPPSTGRRAMPLCDVPHEEDDFGACAHCAAFGLMPDASPDRRGSYGAIFVSALRPCTGAIFMLVLSWRLGAFGMGVLSTLAMGLGAAVAITLVALLSVSARGLMRRIVSSDNRRGLIAIRLAETAAGLLVIGLGILLFIGGGIA